MTLEGSPTGFLIEFTSGRWWPQPGTLGACLIGSLDSCGTHRVEALLRINRAGLDRVGLWWPFTLGAPANEVEPNDADFARSLFTELSHLK